MYYKLLFRSVTLVYAAGKTKQFSNLRSEKSLKCFKLFMLWKHDLWLTLKIELTLNIFSLLRRKLIQTFSHLEYKPWQRIVKMSNLQKW